MERVTIVLKDGIPIVRDISFVGINVIIYDYDADKPIIRYYYKQNNGHIHESTRNIENGK